MRTRPNRLAVGAQLEPQNKEVVEIYAENLDLRPFLTALFVRIIFGGCVLVFNSPEYQGFSVIFTFIYSATYACAI